MHEKELEKYYHNEYGLLLLFNKKDRKNARRPYSWVDRVLILEHSTVVQDQKFSELDLNEWLWILPDSREQNENIK